MIKKETEKQNAIDLRRRGKTYSEILSIVPVAKSTLAIWLNSVNLSKKQKQRITQKKLDCAKRGGEAKRKQRIEKQNIIFEKTRSEINSLSFQELFLIGIVLYWAEGSKEKDKRPGSQFEFSNMDPRMIKVVLVWLFKVCKINKNMLVFNIFLHQSHKNRVEEIKKYWSNITEFPIDNFSTIYWKKNKIAKTNRQNTGDHYHGLLKIKVKKSSNLVRKIAGWVDGIYERIINRDQF